MHGQHKWPTWTKLNATADVGDSAVTVNGPVNWAVGDEIVVSSSSFYANETHEAQIASLAFDAAANTTRIDLDRPTRYTHLGVLTEAGGRALDMRAEVAVLSRNVVFEGDEEFSDKHMFGAIVLASTPRTPAGRKCVH
jgi:hypothetical protein